MRTTATDRERLYAYLDKTGADYSVDYNPSEEKVSRIRQAIARKNQLFQRAIEQFKITKGTRISF